MELLARIRGLRLRLLTVFVGTSLAMSSASGGVEPVSRTPQTVRGKTLMMKVEGVPTPVIDVGRNTYRLLGDAEVLARLGKLKRKYLEVRGVIGKTETKNTFTVSISAIKDIAQQKPAAVRGTVRSSDGDARKPSYVLAADSAEIHVELKSGRKFAAFVGLHVEALGFLSADTEVTILEKVTKVKRKLLPGERDPKDAPEALGGKWKGAFVATEIPKGVPLKPGDYGVRFSADEKLSKVTGRLMKTYDIVGIKVRKWNQRSRTIEFDIDYDFGRGSSSVRCSGSFGPDWKVVSGEWKSGSIGKGTFRLVWQ